MIYPIVIYGNEVLRKQCEEIAPDYPEVKKLVEDMFQTLGEAEGVGLAAPQSGKAIRLFPNAPTTSVPLSIPKSTLFRRRRKPITKVVFPFRASMPMCLVRWPLRCVISTKTSSSTTRSSTD